MNKSRLEATEKKNIESIDHNQRSLNFFDILIGVCFKNEWKGTYFVRQDPLKKSSFG